MSMGIWGVQRVTALTQLRPLLQDGETDSHHKALMHVGIGHCSRECQVRCARMPRSRQIWPVPHGKQTSRQACLAAVPPPKPWSELTRYKMLASVSHSLPFQLAFSVGAPIPAFCSSQSCPLVAALA
eukprot:1146977-Pelagomonas_calceolata.AAC.1